MPAPAFDSLSELILSVEDVDRMTSFYGEVLGLDLLAGAPEHGFVRFDTGECHLCLHAGGSGERGRDAPRFVFEVTDLEAARAHLQGHGVELGEVREPAPDTRVCDGVDPEGNRFAIETTG